MGFILMSCDDRRLLKKDFQYNFTGKGKAWKVEKIRKALLALMMNHGHFI